MTTKITIPEAIEILRMEASAHLRLGHDDVVQAFELGIEALKRESQRRHGLFYAEPAPLPGEKKD